MGIDKKMRYDFGKIDYYGIGRKINRVTVDVSLRDVYSRKPVFAANASVWNGKETDIIYGGQILDELCHYIKSEKFRTIHQMWKKYHLNNLHAGTKEQEELLTEVSSIKSFDEKRTYLKERGMYEVIYNGKPYRYGSGWIYYGIPEDDLKTIRELVGDVDNFEADLLRFLEEKTV